MAPKRGRILLAAVAAMFGVVGGVRANPELRAQAQGSTVSRVVPAPTSALPAESPSVRVDPEPAYELSGEGGRGEQPDAPSGEGSGDEQKPAEAAPSQQVRAFQAPSWDQAVLPPVEHRATEVPPPSATPAPTGTPAPWAIPVRVPMDGWVARPRPARDPRNAATRLDPASMATGLVGITFAGTEITATELLTGEPAVPGVVDGRSMWTVEIAYASDHRFDEVVAAELIARQARGFRVILRVDYARKQPVPPAGDEAALAEYVATFIRLHRLTEGRVRYYLVGNEGNVDSSGGDPSRVTECLAGRDSCAPEWYVQVYRAVRAGLRGQTDAYLIVGAPSPGGPKDPMRWTDGTEYLRSILSLLHPLEIDGVALHAYGAPADRPDHGLGQFTAQLADQLRAVEDSGLVSAPVFLTEINQESAPAPEFVRGAFEWIDGHNRRSAVDIVAACWFVYHDATGEWRRYSLEDRPEILGALRGVGELAPGR